MEYVCRGYHRNGKLIAASHRIHEEVLDAAVQEYAELCGNSVEEVNKLAQMQKMWALRKPILDAHILSLQKRIQELEQEIDGIVMEKLKINSISLEINPSFLQLMTVNDYFEIDMLLGGGRFLLLFIF